MGSKRTASGAFTDDGKKRSNAVGTCGSAQQAKAQLGIDGNVTTKDGKKGGEKWRILRTYIKDESGSKLYRKDYNAAEYTALYTRVANHALLGHIKDALLRPRSQADHELSNALKWAISDAWKKKRESARANAEGSDDEGNGDDDGDEFSDDGPVLQLTPKKKRRVSPLALTTPYKSECSYHRRLNAAC
jgi:hypothetical protein